MKDILSFIVVSVILLALSLAFLKYDDAVRDLFRLSGNSSVYDFQTSSISDSVAWLERMCRDGVCLDKVDWRCGFELGDDMKMSQCFTKVSNSAKSWVKLDKIRKYCGKKFAKYTGRFGTKIECDKVGGKWGKIKHVPEIQR